MDALFSLYSLFLLQLERVTNQLLQRIERERAVIDSSIFAMNHNVAESIAYLRYLILIFYFNISFHFSSLILSSSLASILFYYLLFNS